MTTQIPPSALVKLLQLEQRARACEDMRELGFVMVNETSSLVPYRQAVLWTMREGKGEVVSLSGLAIPAQNAPFTAWVSGMFSRHAAARESAGVSRIIPASDEREMWEQYLPPHALWVPLRMPENGRAKADMATEQKMGSSAAQTALVFFREQDWTRQDEVLITSLTEAYAHAWRALGGERRLRLAEAGWGGLCRRMRQRRWQLVLAGVILASMLFPVRQSVLAPAEVVPRAPFTVRAPLGGVVERIVVAPNQRVQQGDLLVRLDARELEGKLEFARQTLAVADAELRQGQQQALFDERSKAALGVLTGQREQAAGDVAYLESMLARTAIHADRPGVAVFDDPQEWTGRPVALGERILSIADPADVELEMHIALADAIALQPGADVRLFMNAEPDVPVDATLRRLGYRAVPVADGTLAYRARAEFFEEEGTSPLRIGRKGTAKLYGERTVLGVYLFRRPLTSLRLWLGI